MKNLKEYVEDVEELSYIISTVKEHRFDKNELFKSDICKTNLLEINVKFDNINNLSVENLEYVINNNLYEINVRNFQAIYKCNIDTIILTKNKECLNYVLLNYNEFGKNVYLKSNIKLNNKKIIDEILDKEDLDDNFRNKILEKEKIKVDYDKDNIDMILKYNKLNPTWNNINKLFESRIELKKIVRLLLNNEEYLFDNIKLISSDISFILYDEFCKIEEYDIALKILNYIHSLNIDIRVKLNKNFDKNFIKTLVEKNYVDFNKNNYNIISNLEDDYRIIFVKNAYKSIDYNCLKFGNYKMDEVCSLLNKENVTDKDFEIINKAYLFFSKKLTETEIKNNIYKIFKYLFSSNKKYKFHLKSGIYNNIFDNYKELFKMLSYGNKIVIFILK